MDPTPPQPIEPTPPPPTVVTTTTTVAPPPTPPPPPPAQPTPPPPPPVVPTAPVSKGKKGKVIATVLGVIVLVAGLLAGLVATTNIEDRFTVGKKATCTCDGFANPNEIHCNTNSCSQFQCIESAGSCSWQAVSGCGVCGNQAICSGQGACGGGPPPTSCEEQANGNLGCGADGQYPCCQNEFQCSGSCGATCDINHNLPVAPDDRCRRVGTPPPSPPPGEGEGSTSGCFRLDTNQTALSCANFCAGGSNVSDPNKCYCPIQCSSAAINFDANNCAVVPSGCFGRVHTCGGDYISQGRSCNENPYPATGVINAGETICASPVCGKTVQADISCTGGEFAGQNGYRSVYGGTCVGQPPPPPPPVLKDCGATCTDSSECVSDLTCAPGTPRVCYGARCGGGTPPPGTPTPTPTPPPVPTNVCQQVIVQSVTRNGTVVTPTPAVTALQAGDVVVFRGFVNATGYGPNAAVSIQFSVYINGVAQTPQTRSATLSGGQYVADSTPITMGAGNYIVVIYPIIAIP